MSSFKLVHPQRLIVVVLFCVLFFVGQGGHAASDPHEPCASVAGTGAHVMRTVFEGRGLEGIAFDFTSADVESVLGPAEGGSEHHLSYASSGIRICLCGQRIKDIHFQEGFRGKLHASGLGIGSDLESVMAAYGDVKEEKIVDSICGWWLDRVLLVRADPDATDEPAYRLSYYSFGLFFLFDDDELVVEFGIHPTCSDKHPLE